MERMRHEGRRRIEDRMVTKQIEKAQRKVEAHNFDIRKHLLDFDDVANDQRKVIYQQRNELLEGESVARQRSTASARTWSPTWCARYVPPNSIDEQWDLAGARSELADEFGLQLPICKRGSSSKSEIDAEDDRSSTCSDAVDALFARQGGADRRRDHAHAREAHHAQRARPQLEGAPGAAWITCARASTCAAMRRSSRSRSSSAKSFELFSEMLDRIKPEVVQLLARVRIRSEEEVAAMEAEQQRLAEAPAKQMRPARRSPAGGCVRSARPNAGGRRRALCAVARQAWPKVGRNEPCPCGSGKKYKHCHGQLA